MERQTRWCVALLMTMGLLSGACSAAPDDAPAQAAPAKQGKGTAGTPETGATETPAPSTARMTFQIFLTEGETLAPAVRSIPATPRVGSAALGALLAGPKRGEDENSSQIPPSARLLDLAIANGIATVDLSGDFASGGGSLSERMRLAQVVYTLTQFPTVTGVLFELDGEPVTSFSGEGIDVSKPQTRADYLDLAPSILVESPRPGSTVSSPMTVSGTANVFEATVSLRLLDAEGNELTESLTTATCGTGCRGSFSTRLTFQVDEEQRGTLVVFEASAEDGRPIHVVRVPVVLTP